MMLDDGIVRSLFLANAGKGNPPFSLGIYNACIKRIR